jgi:hypothetical protein
MDAMRKIAAILPAAAFVSLSACSPSPEGEIAAHQSTIERYCLDCHNSIDREGGLVLENFDLGNVARNAETLEKMLLKLEGQQMPPPGGPRPEPEAVDSMVEFLTASLDANAAANPAFGRTSIHRLNRSEYGNAIRDLLGIAIDPREFLPADDEGYGFDNIADILRVSPSLLEQYLAASSKIAALAVGDMTTPVVSGVYRAPPDLAQDKHIEGLPLGTRGGLLIEHYFPLDAEYDFAVFLQRNIVGYMTGLEWPHELEISIDGERVFLAPVGGDADNAMSDANFSAAADAIDERLRTRVFVEAGTHDVGVAFIARNAAESHEPLELHTRDHDLQNMNGLPVVDYVNLIGPLNPTGPGDTAARAKIFACRPATAADELPCAEQILESLARRAYRRPVREEEIGTLLDLFEQGREGQTFDAGIQMALRALLTSPQFLFRSVTDPAGLGPGDSYLLDDYALASRLSFFLWSSLPDDELLEHAAQQRLGDPTIYEQQVRRMLADPRASALVENFAGQWLFLRNLQSARPDIATFPDFDENLRRALQRETELVFTEIVREDRSVVDLLDADFTYLNERLASHYGIDGIYGSHFRRIDGMPEERRGILGHGSILTVTSYPNRTSPVLRGKWVMENVLGTPAPAPPPNVPALEENEPGRAARSVRERLAEHRANPICSSCHDIMDPLGLALENYDAVGRWRLREPGGNVDSRGQMPDGSPVDGVRDLRSALAARPERFALVLTEKLMTYALGRGLEYFDMPAVRSIVRDAARNDYRFSALVLGIVRSDAFRIKEIQPPEPTPAPGSATARRD